MWVGSASDIFSEKRFKSRVRFLSVVFAVGFGVILFRLFILQVVEGDKFAEVSESNRTKTLFLGAPRGNFLDRGNDVIVANRPSWSMMYSVPDESTLTHQQVADRLKPFLDQFPGRWERRLRRAFKTKQMVRLVEDVPTSVAFGLREMGALLPGLQMEMEFRRSYPFGIQSPQLMGYLREIDEQELKEDFWFARKPGDLVGKMGLEKLLDTQLRGRDGGMLIEVDSIGRLKRVIRELPYQRGSSVKLTLDKDLQKIAQESLAATKTQRGAAIVLDIRTGAVLTWVSAPAFDASGSLAQDVTDPNLPFFDRVFKGASAPGSIFKIISAIAGFEAGKLKTSEKIHCKGYVLLKDRRMKVKRYSCWRKHGPGVDFWRGMTESCNSYFYLLAEKVGAQKMHETAKKFGMGQSVQKIFPYEHKGNNPSPTWKRKQGLGGWSTGDSYNMAIGQGYVTATPIQLAVMMAGVASRGKIYRPYVIEKMVNKDNDVTFSHKPILEREIELDEDIWSNILHATQLVVEKGTGKACRIRWLEVHGKTGTAQNPHGDDHAWFVASAGYPDEAPILSVCVFVENGGHGGSAAAPIARRLIEAALPPKPPKETI